MFLRAIIAALLFALPAYGTDVQGGAITGAVVATVADNACSAPGFLACSDFEETGTPTAWTVTTGTPDFDFAVNGQESLRIVGATPEQNTQATQIIGNSDTVKCITMNIDIDGVENGLAFYATGGDGTWSASNWTMTGFTGGNYRIEMGGAFSAAITPSGNTQKVELEIDGNNGSGRYSIDDGLPVTVSGTAETGEVRSPQYRGGSTTAVFHVENWRIDDGVCDM